MSRPWRLSPRRLPLRWRVTAVFASAAAVVLAVLGVFLHVRLTHQLDDSIAATLRQRLTDVSAVVASAPGEGLGPLDPGTPRGERSSELAQLLAAGGSVTATEGAPDEPLLSGAALTAALAGTVQVMRQDVPDRGRGGGEGDGRVALLAREVDAQTVIVGTGLAQRDRAVTELDSLLGLGLPIALVLSALAGAWASGLALAPVERIRRRAEVVGIANLGERLPEPVADDELRRLARTLNAMLARLEDGYRREQAFVDDAAHELRTPLTTLRGELELATNRPRERAELEATVHYAREQTERLVALSNDLLVLARAAHGTLPIRRQDVAVGDLLDGAARRARTQRGSTSVRAVAVDPALRVDVDRLRIEQALDNLIVNALEHGAGDVTVAASREADMVRLTVDDVGPGIDPELAGRAFDRFTRGDDARVGRGTGLGLAIVEAIADAHGGEAGIGPSPTAGTRAWLRLPAAAG